MEQLRDYTPCIDDDDDDDGYDSPPATENWDAECNEYAAFLDHRRMWAIVMAELVLFRPLERVEKRQRPTKLIDRRGRSLPRLHFN